MTLSISSDPLRKPTVITKSKPVVSEAEMQQAVRTLLLGMGEDPDREGLRDTPKRVVNALKFLTSGYHQSLDELLNGAVFHEDTNEMVGSPEFMVGVLRTPTINSRFRLFDL